MRIRQKITLWITGAGLLAGLICGILVSLELIEQPYELLDAELDSQARALLAGVLPGSGCGSPTTGNMLDAMGHLYWFKVYNPDGSLVYASSMTRLAPLELRETGRGYNIAATIPPGIASLEQDDSGEVTFRVRVFRIPVNGRHYLVQIARPMEKLQEEIEDLVIGLVLGLVGFALLLVVFGYLAAGRILRPISEITDLARQITDQTLDRRVQVGKNPDEIRELALALNRMFDRLDESFSNQKMFMASGAHELKTPLALQRLFFSDLLQRDDLPRDLVPRLRGQLENQARMERLVRDLLELSALEMTDASNHNPVDLGQLCRDVLHEFQEIIQVRGLGLETEITPVSGLKGDEERLRRLLINLLDNAIKYNRSQQGWIRVRVDQEPDQVRLTIANSSSTPIPPRERQRVFEQFYRVEKSRAADRGGSGLGLAIVKRIVDLHQGRVWISTGNDNQVTVTVILPRERD